MSINVAKPKKSQAQHIFTNFWVLCCKIDHFCIFYKSEHGLSFRTRITFANTSIYLYVFVYIKGLNQNIWTGARRDGIGEPWRQSFGVNSFSASTPIWIDTLVPPRPGFEATEPTVCAVTNRMHGFKLFDNYCTVLKYFICEMEPSV